MSSIPSSKMPHAVTKPTVANEKNPDDARTSSPARLIPVGLVAAGAAVLGVAAAAAFGAVRSAPSGKRKSAGAGKKRTRR